MSEQLVNMIARVTGQSIDVVRGMVEDAGLMEARTITLGELIGMLESAPNQDARVVFDFCGVIPSTFGSWRGSYDQLALGWEEPRWNITRNAYGSCTVRELLDRARAADGATFQGYKGGDYSMCRDTPLWVDNDGEYTSTAITDVHCDDYECVLATKRETDIW